jgi:DNA-binding MarR family transcriptional regulator
MNKIDKNSDNDITLKLLDELTRESLITQRTLSSRLDIALGLVNAYIKRLAKKGYIKITKGPMNRVKYAITPEGFTHRVRLTYDYMHSSINYFKDARKRIDDIYRLMIDSGAKNILIWGDGEIAELSYISLRGLPLSLVGVIDGQTLAKDFFGHRIYSFKEIDKLEYDAVLIASFNKEELKIIIEAGIEEKKIYSL